MKDKIIQLKNHVYQHRVRYAIIGTAIPFLLLQHHTATQINEFLEEKGIDPMEYYLPEYFEELQAAAR
jgi:hypothetical protein